MGPENFHIGAGSLSIDGQDVGLTTEDGVVIFYKPDLHMHYSSRYGSTPVDISILGQDLTVEVWMAENTLNNITNAMAGAVVQDAALLFGGRAGRLLTGKTIVLTPFDGTQKWYFKKAIPVSQVEVAYKVNDERIYHVVFQATVSSDSAEQDNLAYLSPFQISSTPPPVVAPPPVLPPSTGGGSGGTGGGGGGTTTPVDNLLLDNNDDLLLDNGDVLIL